MGFLPMMISRSSPAPPFIHDRIYQCSEGDVKEPIARAMVCINAHIGAMPSGRNFVNEMVHHERDGILESFILALFGDSKGQIRSGELHLPYLLKMVRKVAQRYQQDLVNPSADSASYNWKRWIFVETLRRTVFLVHAMNVLSARLKRQNPFFHEALDDDLILDMPLPAPASR
ncbi:hypothetical protein P153DRAFT_435105 [Dothidotthia symphoricarpi CBS 119687]|uniref:Uncharacterized protein n=1 Tax=Dothidotthia symphoricarpi CBS 119687 TaxID=1392245 RepID=A0A6A5ZYG2_9PLEO|nr:uncharacterized protein P153DRAFT_435105 [Dothidotthia symphoricarpi CBS 119687]KAF2124336.1 hypothetical protein P153DRAFT_435105 [Dothidotthia symphoricarpi CBS 119687]